jgi:hypothetical protein
MWRSADLPGVRPGGVPRNEIHITVIPVPRHSLRIGDKRNNATAKSKLLDRVMRKSLAQAALDIAGELAARVGRSVDGRADTLENTRFPTGRSVTFFSGTNGGGADPLLHVECSRRTTS